MSEKFEDICKRRQELVNQAAVAAEQDIAAAMNGLRASNCDTVLRLVQEINILDAALERLRSMIDG